MSRRLVWAGVVLAAGMAFMGCGAAYYGGAIGFLATQKKTTTIDTSFPDAVPTDPAVPAFATLKLESTKTKVTRRLGGGFALGTSAGAQTAEVEDFKVTSVEFLTGYGQARSNRDVGTTLKDGDKIVIRINEDASQAVTFVTTDFGPGTTADVGTRVAAVIQAKVRALSPVFSTVPADAYKNFSVTFDAPTQSYLFLSGVPGPTSEVLFEAAKRADVNEAESDVASKATATRLGLGVAQGGIEVSGAEVLRLTVLNRGTDTIGAGTKITVYLSHDKILNAAEDPRVGEFEVTESIAVGQARRFSYRNQAPPDTLVRSDFTAGKYYALFSVDSSGGEKVLSNNTTFSLAPLEVYQPVDDPATEAAETADTLDFAITKVRVPIATVTGSKLEGVVSVTNLGGPVPAAGVTLDIDAVLSANSTFDSTAAFVSSGIAGVRVNPRDPNRAITIKVSSTGTTGAVGASLFGDTITVTHNPASAIAPVQSFIDALNNVPGAPVDAFSDGVGNPATEPLNGLLSKVTSLEQVARDVFLGTRQVTFVATSRQQETRAFAVSGTPRTQGFSSASLPAKLISLFRVRRAVASGAAPENSRDDVREAPNFTRLYDRTSAFFDPATSVLLPTRTSSDFAVLDAVTQRPVNSGSLQQGQQRVFSFVIPSSGLTTDESQALIALRSANFDAHLDLLNGVGSLLASSDDSALGTDPLVYTPLFANGGNRTFYLVVSPARFDESDLGGGDQSFDLTISVNSRGALDTALVKASGGRNVLAEIEQRYEVPDGARLENDSLIPLSLEAGKGEVAFVLPQRANVLLRTQPVFTSQVTTTITRFVSGSVPSPVEFQTVLDAAAQGLVYKPSAGGVNSPHVFEAGVYVLAFQAVGTDKQPLRVEVKTQFIPPVSTTQ
ncbi:MAG: hypothetical protein AB7G23_19410 [Vicinamibacterales bacterium]